MSIDWGTFVDRSLWLAGGVVVGRVWGLSSRNAKEFKQMKNITKDDHRKNEKGSLNLQSSMLLVIVVLVAVSSFMSVRTSAQVADQSDRIEAVGSCTSKVLFQALDALNERTKYSGAQSDANIGLQKSQLLLLTNSLGNNSTEKQRRQAFNDYIGDLQDYVTVVTNYKNTQTENPLPTPAQYAQCLSQARDG